MGETTIQWAHFSFNPWVGCQRVSPGCTNCYAEAYDRRVGGLPKGQRKDPEVAELRWGPKAARVRTSDANWRKPLAWNEAARKAGERHRVFCSSLADVFEDRFELEPWRLQLFDLIRQTPNLDWLLLTKRPENVRRMISDAIDRTVTTPWDTFAVGGWLQAWSDGRPPANVWLGTTVEDQKRTDERIPELLKVPAAVRFLSCEPLLERVDLSKWIGLYPLNATNRDGRSVVRSGASGLAEGASGRLGLAGRAKKEEQERQSHHTCGDSVSNRRGRGTRLPDSEGDGGWSADDNSGASAGLEGFDRPHSEGADDQPQERGEVGQPPEQSGIGHVRGAGETRSGDSEGRSTRPEWREELHGQAHERGREGDPSQTIVRREPEVSREGLRGQRPDDLQDRQRPALDLVIIGGESGPGARPFHLDWARDLVDQCRHAGAAPFVKQLGSLPVANENDDRRAIFKIRDSAGGDPNEWPEDLRVREFPR